MYTRAIKKNLKILTRVSESQCQDATLSPKFNHNVLKRLISKKLLSLSYSSDVT